jgi:hypothetical protein
MSEDPSGMPGALARTPAARRPLTSRFGRGGKAAAVALLLGVGLVVAGNHSDAKAFDCRGANACPYVKVDNTTHFFVRYQISGDLVSDDGRTVYAHWHEKDPTFTLWHWRYYGGGGKIKLTVDTWNDLTFGLRTSTFEAPASQGLCIKIDTAGAYQGGGCTDFEDPAS